MDPISITLIIVGIGTLVSSFLIHIKMSKCGPMMITTRSRPGSNKGILQPTFVTDIKM